MRIVALALALAFQTHGAFAADHLTVLLDWFVNPDHAPILVAQQIGAYAAAGLDVELIAPADATMPPKLVAAGHGDIALTSEPQFLEQIAAGLPLVRVGVLIDHPLSTLVALRDAGIAHLADLRGKRIGYGSGEVEATMVGAMLRHDGVPPAEVHMVQIGEQLVTALLTRQVDAVTVYRNFEPFELAANGAQTIGFDYEAYGVPDFDELIFVVRAGGAGDTRIARFLRATAQGAAYLRAHPAESWTAFAQAHPDLDDALNHQAWTATLGYFASDPLELDRAKYDSFGRFLLSGLPPSSKYTVVPH